MRRGIPGARGIGDTLSQSGCVSCGCGTAGGRRSRREGAVGEGRAGTARLDDLGRGAPAETGAAVVDRRDALHGIMRAPEPGAPRAIRGQRYRVPGEEQRVVPRRRSGPRQRGAVNARHPAESIVLKHRRVGHGCDRVAGHDLGDAPECIALDAADVVGHRTRQVHPSRPLAARHATNPRWEPEAIHQEVGCEAADIDGRAPELVGVEHAFERVSPAAITAPRKCPAYGAAVLEYSPVGEYCLAWRLRGAVEEVARCEVFGADRPRFHDRIDQGALHAICGVCVPGRVPRSTGGMQHHALQAAGPGPGAAAARSVDQVGHAGRGPSARRPNVDAGYVGIGVAQDKLAPRRIGDRREPG